MLNLVFVCVCAKFERGFAYPPLVSECIRRDFESQLISRGLQCALEYSVITGSRRVNLKNRNLKFKMFGINKGFSEENCFEKIRFSFVKIFSSRLLNFRESNQENQENQENTF